MKSDDTLEHHLKVAKDFIVVYNLINKQFKDDKKSAMWISTSNRSFGDTAPLSLILVGRGHKVISFIKQLMDG